MQGNPNKNNSVLSKNPGDDFSVLAEGKGSSKREEIMNVYMQTHGIEKFLIIAIREAISEEFLPVNPFPAVIRSLKQSVWRTELDKNFKKLNEEFKKSPVSSAANIPFNISLIKHPKCDIFGLSHILEWIDPERLLRLRKSIVEYLPDYRNQVTDGKVAP